MKRDKKIFKIDPLKSFTQLPIFWITFISLLLLSLIAAISIALNSNINWTFDYNGFNSLIEIFKVPLSIMALAITFVAILATMHRSAQTREQIIITDKQNVFSNYFKHIEEFEKYFISIIGNGPVNSSNIRITYKHLFPNSFDGNYSINNKLLVVIEDECSECINLLKKFNQDENYSTHKLIYDIRSKFDFVFSYLNLIIRLGGKRLNVDGKIIIVPEHMKDYLSDIKRISLILVQILSFDHLLLIPNSLIQLTNLNLSVVPDLNIFTPNKFVKFNVFGEE